MELPSRIHFLGVGGVGMSPLAGICLKNDVVVTGSDKASNSNQEDLVKAGADLWCPHSLKELKKRQTPDLCVYSTAITFDNEELQYLKQKGVELWHRSDMLKKIADQFSQQIVIAGTHGKTTTTAMLVWILEHAGLKPSWVLGGVLKQLGAYSWNEESDIFVFEGDESDQSFLKSNPHIGVVTSLEPDHLENYEHSFEVQIAKFQEFVSECEYSILNSECENTKKFLLNDTESKKNRIPYQSLKVLDNVVLGEHNRANASAALSTYKLLLKQNLNETQFKQALHALKNFPGVHRRFELIGTTDLAISLIDDYAHHPTEVKAAIKATKEFMKENNSLGKLLVLFQPHLPTRLRDLWEEFVHSFNGADKLFINDLYIARGKPIDGVNSENLVKDIQVHRQAVYCQGTPLNLIDIVLKEVNIGDTVLLLGAGDITEIREPLFESLRWFPKTKPKI